MVSDRSKVKKASKKIIKPLFSTHSLSHSHTRMTGLGLLNWCTCIHSLTPRKKEELRSVGFEPNRCMTNTRSNYLRWVAAPTTNHHIINLFQLNSSAH